MRRHARTDAVPPDLQLYDPARWIRAALDNADQVGLGHVPVEARPTYFYTPLCYRKALTDALGARAGDDFFFHVLKPCPFGRAPAGVAETW